MSGVNFNTSINTRQATTKVEQPKSEQIKEFVQSEDGQEKIALGLGALAVIAAAGIALKKGRPSEAVEEIKDLAQKTSADEIKKAAQHAQATARDIAHKEAQQQLAQKSAQLAKETLNNGGNYGKTKEIALKNLTHDGKKVVKEVLKEQQEQILSQQKTIQQATTEAMNSAKNGAAKAKNASLGIKNATKENNGKALQEAFNASMETRRAANKLAEVAEQNPTRKNIKRARYAENKAIEARKNSRKTFRNGIQATADQIKAEKIKSENITAQQASPHYEDGLIKQMINADKTTSKEVNALKKARKTPAWANAEKRLSKMTPEQLQGVIANPKSSNIEVKVAQYLLG